MKTQKPGIVIVLALVAVAASATVAQATVLTDYVDLTPSLNPSSLTFLLPTFNPGLGTLNSVELTLTPTLGDFGSAALNLTATPQTVSGATVGFSPSSLVNAGVGLSASFSTSSGTLTSPDYTAAAGPFVITDGPALPFTWSTAASSAGLTPSDYNALGGDLNVTVSLTATVSGTDDTYAIGSYSHIGGNLEVQFNYTSVPEPTTMALSLIPFGCVVLTALRRKHLK